MQVFLVFTHDWDGLEFKAVYTNLEAAVEHARTLHMKENAEVHEATLSDVCCEEKMKEQPTTRLWTSFTHSGAI